MKSLGAQQLRKFRDRWSTVRFVTMTFVCLGIILAVEAILQAFLPHSLHILTLVLPLAILALYLRPVFWKLNELQAATYLDDQHPELEDSTSLFLKDEAELSLLERFQQSKINERLPVFTLPGQTKKHFIYSTVFFVLALAMLLLLKSGKIQEFRLTNGQVEQKVAATGTVQRALPPHVSSATIRIIPPRYTGRPERAQKDFALRVEVGSSVRWRISTSSQVQSLKIIFNDRERFQLKPANKERSDWAMETNITHAGFYQLEVDGVKSALYQIEVIPDLPVQISITSPKQHTTIDFGQAPVVTLQARLTDDYSIKEAYISATMASGKGEGVSFTEKRIRFNQAFNGSTSATLKQSIQLQQLGMKPGDELYFFINAWDNKGQNSRSDVYFVSMVDTAELMSMAGMLGGVNLVPEYFRSQRQIIIDTEKLLREKSTISIEAFKSRSNDLGVDQKLIRLRYGKFLGEESETDIGPGDDHDDHDGHDHGDRGATNEDKTQALMDSYAHNHDVAEDATFFEPELKAQLKAVLTEMWNAELQLRTYNPQAALPFEYKALRQLKDLQQKSRAYVAKTVVKAPQLKAEKRLSGVLDKIGSPVSKRKITEEGGQSAVLKKALGLLEQRKTGYRFTGPEMALLKEAEVQIVRSAAGNPATYLTALTQFRRIQNAKKVDLQDIEGASRAIARLIAPDHLVPQKPASTVSSSFYESYFKHLQPSQ